MYRWVWLVVLVCVGCRPRIVVERCLPADGSVLSGDGRAGFGGGAVVDVAYAEDDAADVTLARVETCDNGIDDDLDGVVDDGCLCRAGATQRCYEGPERTGGVGVCARGTSTCEAVPSGTAWGACVGAQLPAPEQRNGLDDDCDGLVDESFECALEPEPCFHGAPSLIGVGACRAGSARCVQQFEPDGPVRLVRDGAVCVGEVLPRVEVCDGVDNDCNGQVDDLVERCDGVDNDCDGEVDEDCARAMAAQTLVYRRLGSGGSAIWPGSERSMLLSSIEPAMCAIDEVAVELADGTIRCVAEPTISCPSGQQLDYEHPAGWRCVPCVYVIQFGGIFQYERVCAPEGRLKCWDGTTPTFVEESRRWECRPTCNNGLYDLLVIDGRIVCVPC